MASQFDVTVIIPAYENPEILLRTLASVYGQKAKSLTKVVVVDDHSSQRLGPIIKKAFPQTTIIRNKINLRSGPARNQALRFIDTEYVAFLDADDLWEPAFLSKMVKLVSESNVAGAVSFSKQLFDTDLPPSFKIKIKLLSLIRDLFMGLFYVFNGQTAPQSAFYLCQLSHLVFRSQTVKGIKFDPKYNFGGEDWKFMLEVMDRGKIKILPRRLVDYRYHATSSTQKKINLQRKWASYTQLFDELDKRGIGGIMKIFFRWYISMFKVT